MRFNTIICSYIFFALFSFTALALVSSEFSHTFSQVFALLTQDGKTYDIFCLALLSIAFVIACINPIRIYARKEVFGKTVPFIILLVAILAICCLAMIMFQIYTRITIHYSIPIDAIIESQNAEPKSEYSYYTSIHFIVSIMCWITLIMLPLICRLLSFRADIKNRIGKSILILQPSPTTIAIAITASAFQPYYSDVVSRYADMFFTYSALCLLIYIFIKDNRQYRFYEYANMIILALMLIVLLLCNNVMFDAEFYNAKLCFFALAMLSWCGEWVENRDNLYKKIS